MEKLSVVVGCSAPLGDVISAVSVERSNDQAVGQSVEVSRGLNQSSGTSAVFGARFKRVLNWVIFLGEQKVASQLSGVAETAASDERILDGPAEREAWATLLIRTDSRLSNPGNPAAWARLLDVLSNAIDVDQLIGVDELLNQSFKSLETKTDLGLSIRVDLNAAPRQ